MHISRGLPLISAEHEPHLPALQFQRTARSGACSAWILWTTSRTTMPSVTSVWKVWNVPSPSGCVRHNLNVAVFAMRVSAGTKVPALRLLLLDHFFQVVGDRRQWHPRQL